MAKQQMSRLVVPLVIKAASVDESARTFEGLASTWDQDLGNDVIHQGAFKETIKDWKKGPDALPLLNSHNQFDIFSAIGQATDLKETKDGLDSTWEVLDGPEGDKVLNRLRPSKRTNRPIVGKMSIGFIPEEFKFEQPKGTDSFWDRVRHITKAALKEVSLVLFPMNPGASIDASTVKSFLYDAKNTDPTKLDYVTRKELRALTGQIGVLLKKYNETTGRKSTIVVPVDLTTTEAKDTDGFGDDEEDDVEHVDPQDNPIDDQDDGSDDNDDEDNTADGTSTEETDESKKSEQTPAESPVYLYSEALQQRLQKTLFRKTVSDITNK